MEQLVESFANKCTACGYDKFYAQYKASVPEWKFLWFKSEAQPEHLRMECGFCHKVTLVKLGAFRVEGGEAAAAD